MSEAAAFTIGVEEEYQIIDPHTRELACKSNGLVSLHQYNGQKQHLLCELHRCQIEVASGICHTLETFAMSWCGAGSRP